MIISNDSVERIGAQVRAARRERGWSTRAAAGRLGLSVRFLNELERGKATARLDKVIQALEGLGLAITVGPGRTAAGAAVRAEVLSRLPLLRTIAGARGARALWLFGSAARAETGPGSDLDFLVELEEGRSLLDLVALKQDLEALFGRRVDVFTRDSLKPAVLAGAQADLVRVL
jgi:predicted nucleotidyltransferase